MPRSISRFATSRALARSPLPAIVLCAVALPAQVPAELVEPIRDQGLNKSRAMVFLDHLTNSIGHRLTGSDNFTAACEWTRGEFEKMGLRARLEPWGEWKLVWNRGQWSGRVLEPEPQELQVATPAWTPGTKGRQSGPLVAMPAVDELRSRPGAFAGKYLLGTIPGHWDPGLKALDEALVISGALGLVGPPSGRTDKTYESGTQIRVFGNHITAMGSLANVPKVPLICVRPDQYEKLAAMVGSGKTPVVEFEIRNRFREGPIVLNNVIADLVGSEKPDECVVVCGHLDSWHQAAGATDNGTGSSSTLEAARILTAVGAKPKRTIRFILWGGEEQGLLGSKRYVDMHRQEMAKVAAVFNHDSGTNWAHGLTVSEAMEATMRKALAPVFDLPAPQEGFEQESFVLSTRPTISAGGGSDHASFAVALVPAFSWGLQRRGNRPYGYGWHSQWDTYDIAVPKYQAHTSTVIALTALAVANLPEQLTREGVVKSTGGGGRADTYVGVILGATMQGPLFEKVEAKGPAAAAGVQAGDRILLLNGAEMQATFEILGLVRDREGEAIELTLQRGKEKVKVRLPMKGLVERAQANPRRPGGGERRRGGGERRRDGAQNGEGNRRRRD